MNEFRRVRLQCDIEQLAHLRERLDKIRDDEARGRTDARFGPGCSEDALDFLSEASHCCLVVIDRLQKAKACN